MRKFRRFIAAALCAVMLSGCSIDIPFISDEKETEVSTYTPNNIITDNKAGIIGNIGSDEQQSDGQAAELAEQPQNDSATIATGAAATLKGGDSSVNIDGKSFTGNSIYTFVPNTGYCFILYCELNGDAIAVVLSSPADYSTTGGPYGLDSFVTEYSAFAFSLVSGGKSESILPAYTPDKFHNFGVTFQSGTDSSISISMSMDIESELLGRTMHFESSGPYVFYDHEQCGIYEHQCTTCIKDVGVCTVCKGDGKSWGKIGDYQPPCPSCYGTGKCKFCSGTGKVYY